MFYGNHTVWGRVKLHQRRMTDIEQVRFKKMLGVGSYIVVVELDYLSVEIYEE